MKNLQEEINQLALKASINTWADFQKSIVCALLPKQGPARGIVLREMLHLKSIMNHSFPRKSRDEVQHLMKSWATRIESIKAHHKESV